MSGLSLRHLLGLGLAVATVAAGYWAWEQVPSWLRLLPQGPARTVATDFRLLLEILAAFLAISSLDWCWRKIAGDAADPGSDEP